jgi:hypothetical protein
MLMILVDLGFDVVEILNDMFALLGHLLDALDDG